VTDIVDLLSLGGCTVLLKVDTDVTSEPCASPDRELAAEADGDDGIEVHSLGAGATFSSPFAPPGEAGRNAVTLTSRSLGSIDAGPRSSEVDVMSGNDEATEAEEICESGDEVGGDTVSDPM